MTYVNDANVSVISSNGEVYNFTPVGDGKYNSINPFKARIGETYQLEISTGDDVYESSPEEISGSSILDSLYVERKIGNNGLPGAAIQVSNTSDNLNFYKYAFEETYKIVSPFKRQEDLILDENNNFQIIPKVKEEETCYNTLPSTNIIIANTEDVADNSYSGLLINFLNFRNPKIFQRYSILVKQLNISREAFNYFQTISELAENGNVFSQKQPGYLQGNLSSLKKTDSNRKVIGMFSVASVDSKRLFFNYTDIFDIDERPDLFRNCTKSRPPSNLLKEYIKNNAVKFLERTPYPADQYGGGPYLVVNTFCMDCTVYGTNIKPEFWID